MRPIATDVVCRFVGHDREPCKSGWPDRDAIWVVDLVGPTELDGVQIFPCEGEF